MNIAFTPEALADLRAIYKTISDDNERAAANVIARIRQTIMIFERFPLLGRPGRVADTREFAIPGLSYTIVYRRPNWTF
ncbi:type II toxin-antitoxin system RelE/ParE family toxin [Asticcacaulis sp. AND118]|uniref:type II toxin-antitoxin system RelE/ParE family toxin n=1 Tax=Asticcacaulis sp. AND118 TaxID=2840468 RepID=UPI001CFFDC18|nr:type II toxin-antitoxin system RelE/ParE family toxin [Asticcacaulis sp. AND118]UDF02999.1 type II toxin-antitoxin system RelE/ParE family toxin [Asticcacaulis sp. AND118]